MRRSRLVPYLLLVALVSAGCGVGPTDRPVDEGDPAAAAGPDVARRLLPTPDSATSPADLVRNFLQVATGGLSAANDRMRAFLTSSALAHWRDPVPPDNPPLTVVRIVSGPQTSAPVPDPDQADRFRTPVTLEYQVIGTMTDLGRIDDLASLPPRPVTFWVAPDEAHDSNPRIDEMEGWPEGQLLLSEEGLRTYYQIQPIYFWDSQARLLVPDLRYVPVPDLTLDVRAGKILTWLELGPSPWVGGVQRLPEGTSHEAPVTQDGTMRVELSGAADPADPEAVRRLKYQLQWSLTALNPGDAPPRIDLWLDGQQTPADADESAFRRYNNSYSYDKPEPEPFDITRDGVVVATDGTALPVLQTPENSSVEWAAIDRSGDVAALVREEQNNRRYLQILRKGSAPVRAQVPTSTTLGRPSFVPQTSVVLVPAGGNDGRLLAVSTVDGSYEELSHARTGVTAAAVSPDGRRVAIVADGEVYVSALMLTTSGVGVAIGSIQRQVLSGRITSAKAVTWTSESWLLVAGTNGSSPALWRVGADGVLAEDLSGNLGGVSVIDLTCYPLWNGVPLWGTRDRTNVLALTNSVVYTVRNAPDPAPDRVKPFFAT